MINQDAVGTPDLLVEEFAAIFRVHTCTVRRWIAQEQINAMRLPGGQYRIPAEEVKRLRQPKGGKCCHPGGAHHN